MKETTGINNHIESICNLLDFGPLRVIDVGASGSLWSYFQKFLGSRYVEVVMVEPSPLHASQLKKRYESYGNVVIEEVGLYSHDCMATLHYSDTGGASIYETTEGLVKAYVEYHSSGAPNKTATVQLRSVSKWMESLNPRFLLGCKLDTQGCELDIMKAADPFATAGFLCTEAPLVHKYVQQQALSEYIAWFEMHGYDIVDVQLNYSCLVQGANRKAFVRDTFTLEANTSSVASVFKPRCMDGDIYGVKKADASSAQTDQILRFFGLLTLEYYAEAYVAVEFLGLNESQTAQLKQHILSIMKCQATWRDRSRLLNFVLNALSSKRVQRLLCNIRVIPRVAT